MGWFDGFHARDFELGDVRIHARTGGRADGAPLLLIHGYPQTHAIWQRVARELAGEFFLVMPDLRGYGRSSQPPGEPDHANYSKRAMAADLVALMRALGRERFAVCGHDRGGRVAHRMALDHPAVVEKLCLIDIAPTLAMYEATDMAFARAYYHWFFLIQPAPLPERLIGAEPRFYLHQKLGGWGSQGLAHIEPEALADYERWYCAPAGEGGLPPGVHAACEDYRASAGVDLEHDRASRAAGERIGCPLHLLWGERGVVARLFDPLRLWREASAAPVSGRALPAGHFIPEELPAETAAELRGFLGGGR
ncbi:alpha/beta fold hydrolase [Caldimonas tepidiphila]|uniref:alpha/beta fold hydrolase n=1 Tax=Caldimonas tepidiphila TaxID=2315841 RepID=UPI000E5A9662|nr:alpha/beta hydrolase [Caldimonas tepidiphila]